MRRLLILFGVAILLAIGLGVGYTGWKISRSRAAQVCAICNRPVHPESKVIGFVEERRGVFCCPACALTAHRQTGKPVRLISLTDYETKTELLPEQAYIVQDSDVNPCARAGALVDETNTPHQVHFDRCSPSYLAFAHRSAAESFIEKHGGKLMRFDELAAGYRY